MNPTAILALIAELYEQVRALTAENEALRATLGAGGGRSVDLDERQ